MRKRKLRAISLLLAGIMSVGLFAGCSSDSGDNSSDNTDSGGTKDSIVIATSGETPSRAYDSDLQGVEVSDSGILYFEDVYWEE